MKKTLFVAMFLLVASLGVFADDIYLYESRGETGISIASDQIFSRMYPHIDLECQIEKLQANVVSTPNGNFTVLVIPKFQGSNVAGIPQLPVMNRILEIPAGSKAVVRVLAKTEKVYTLKELGIEHPLMPCQPSCRKDEEPKFAYDKAAYSKDEFLSFPLASIEDMGNMRHLRLAFLQVSPIAYNPVQGTLRIANNIRLEVSLEGADIARTAQDQQDYFSPHFNWVQSQVLSAPSLQSLRGGDFTRYPVVYAIVADRMFEEALKPFVAWKAAKGFKVELAFTDKIGNTKEAIQTHLHNLYKNGKPAPTFVLLVGDVAQVPAFAGTQGSYVTDLYYVAVTADKLPDMYCGRFSAQTVEQLLPQLQKTIEYETYAFSDPSFLKSAVLIAGWDSSHAVEWGHPQINYAVENYFNQNYGYDKVNVFLSKGSHQNEANIVKFVKEGAAYVNYTAHGSQTDWSDPGFTINNINSLNNTGKYPLVVGNCCLTNSIQVGTCFGEAWLRADKQGAIGYIGGSSYTYWDEDLWWGNGYYKIAHPNSQGLAPKKADTGKGAYDGAFETGHFSNGSFMMAGNIAVEESTSPRKVYYWEVYHLMGDPSLMVYWGIPKQMTVKYASEVPVATKSVVVTGEAGAYVGISMNNELLGAGLIDKNGEVSIEVQFPASGKAAIVVTKQNRIPYQGTFTVK